MVGSSSAASATPLAHAAASASSAGSASASASPLEITRASVGASSTAGASASPGAYGPPHPWDVEFARRRALVVRAEVSACYKKLDAAIEARTQQHAELSSYIAETVTCASSARPFAPARAHS